MLAPAQVVSTMAGYILLLSCLLVLVSSEDQNPMVKIPHGWLRGVWRESTNGRTFASFRGIPYASPPVGFLRFRLPQVLEAWPGVWDASKPLSVCLQYEPFLKKIIGSEDCLFLNVHTPNLDAGASLPVVIFIHGGAYMYGAGSLYEAEHIMDRDVVVVTLNYRLGPLGFLSTGDEAAPGNFGLKDQAFALKWVRNNIKFFGGNPESVTLTGCSAGGASVHYHYLSPLSKGLFHRGMAFSGSALASWTHSVKAASKAKALAAVVGCPTSDNRVMVDCLRYRPAEVIVDSQFKMFDWNVNMFTMFTPTAEPEDTCEPFLTEYPYHATEAGAMQRVPLIASVTSEEGLYPAAAYQADPSTLSDLESRWENLAPLIFEYNDTLPLDKRSSVAYKIKQEYLGGKPVSQETFPELVQALGDRLFVVSVGKMAQLHALKSGQPTYFYRYAYRATHSISNLMAENQNNYGVSHADDVIFIFKFFNYNDDSPEDVKMKDALLDMVYSYASTGVPKLPNAPVWEKVRPGSKDLDYLDIVSPSKMEMKSSSDLGKKSFWDSLGFLEYQNYNVYIKDELQGLNPIVRVFHGVLQGVWKQSTNGRTYASFQGIPYARPPVGKYRFREPQHLKPWSGVWDASRFLSDCLQYDSLNGDVIGNEDCLFLNVYTPKLNPGESLPVVVFIHGGAFMFGSGALYDPCHLMDRDMVIVTMNYRLGPLGFLSTGDDAAPGNAGLKDQALALKWVRKNILMFGGNPGSVTLTGSSAGGASLFDRGIAFSGSALAPWSYSVKPAAKAKALAAMVGCPTAISREMMDCLRTRPAQVIINAQIKMLDLNLHILPPFRPTMEPKGTQEPFLTEYPYHAMQAGTMSLISSVTSEEGLYPAAGFIEDPDLEFLLDLESRWEHLAINILDYNDTLPLDMRSVVANKIKEEYLGGKPVGQETFPCLVQALSDRLFVVSVSKMAHLHALKSGQPTYFYRYSYRGTYSLSNFMAHNDENYGTSHADDVLFIFKFFPFTDYSPEDIRMRDAMMDMIYSYASTGVPKFPNAPVWAEVKPGAKDLVYLDIVSPNNIGMKSSSDFGKKSFWDSLGFLEDQNFKVRDEL